MISSRDTLTRGMRLVRVENPEEVLCIGRIPAQLPLQTQVILVMAALRARLHRDEAEGFSLATGLEDLLLFKPT